MSWAYIVSYIAGEIGKLPGVNFITQSFFSIDNIRIVPKVRVFVYMDELSSWDDDSLSHSFEPEVESVIMIIKNRNP
jgi:hypothetical protein